ncbi:hypothetical protein JTB14_007652 [Gonioctena quinquepunctata]|nr:hypothetical protein JTB14_007652 [Gonioctena quinquepunctata]
MAYAINSNNLIELENWFWNIAVLLISQFKNVAVEKKLAESLEVEKENVMKKSTYFLDSLKIDENKKCNGEEKNTGLHKMSLFYEHFYDLLIKIKVAEEVFHKSRKSKCKIKQLLDLGILFGTQTGALKPTGFGIPTAQPTKTGFSLPTATSVPTTGLTFGTPSSTATGAPPAFGVGLFGTTTTSSTPTLGLFGAASTAVPTLATSNPPSFGLGGTTTTTASGLSFGLGGTSTSAAPSINLSSSITPSVTGLGGIAPAQTVVSTQKDVSPKEQTLPNEILQTVEGFKEMVKQQKLHSSDIARCSVRDFRKVELEIDHMAKLLSDVENQLQKNRHLAEKLKYDTAKCLQSVEIAQRTQDTPPGLQYENTAPLKYFLDLADKFESDMQALKLQIESADNYVNNNRNPNMLTPQELALGIRRLHETFVALAGRLHSIHSQVESQKESYVNLRKQAFNDHSNPFEKLYKSSELSMINLKSALIYSPPKVATGPTPFSNVALGNSSLLLLQQSQTTSNLPGQATSNTPAFGTSFGMQAPSAYFFGSSGLALNSNSFQLQKPPTGHKRGKQ